MQMNKAYEEKRRATMVWIYRLSQRGLSYLQISEATGVDIAKIKKYIINGERLSTLPEYANAKLKIIEVRK